MASEGHDEQRRQPLAEERSPQEAPGSRSFMPQPLPRAVPPTVKAYWRSFRNVRWLSGVPRFLPSATVNSSSEYVTGLINSIVETPGKQSLYLVPLRRRGNAFIAEVVFNQKVRAYMLIVVTHCLAGIGRTTTMLLAAQLLRGHSWDAVADLAKRRNPHYQLHDKQVEFLKSLAADIQAERMPLIAGA